MTVNPTDPDIIEHATDIPETEADDEFTQLSVEAPEADAAEQHVDLAPLRDTLRFGNPDYANEADLAEQARIVELDEDDYR